MELENWKKNYQINQKANKGSLAGEGFGETKCAG
jgi:hypothetical protein